MAETGRAKTQRYEQMAEAEEMLWKSIVKLDFAAKYALVHPFFSAHFQNEAKTPWRINDLRNDIFHRRAIRDAKISTYFKRGHRRKTLSRCTLRVNATQKVRGDGRRSPRADGED
jgi:hypothetical protein